MKAFDRFLQRWRMRTAARQIKKSSKVIDVGAYHGEFFIYLGDKLSVGFGVEPLLKLAIEKATYSVHPGLFPASRPPDGDWDAITMLAVLEHVPRSEQSTLADACYELLKPGGRIVITVPSPFVDKILDVLKWFKLIDGMSLEEHFGFVPTEVIKIFHDSKFLLISHRRFQLGLNHLFVFEKRSASPVA